MDGEQRIIIMMIIINNTNIYLVLSMPDTVENPLYMLPHLILILTV